MTDLQQDKEVLDLLDVCCRRSESAGVVCLVCCHRPKDVASRMPALRRRRCNRVAVLHVERAEPIAVAIAVRRGPWLSVCCHASVGGPSALVLPLQPGAAFLARRPLFQNPFPVALTARTEVVGH